MKTTFPTSFALFTVSLFISVSIIATTYIFQYYNVSKDNLIYLGFGQLLVGIITPIGIYAGFRSAKNNLNKIGLWGNVLLLLYTLALMIVALAL